MGNHIEGIRVDWQSQRNITHSLDKKITQRNRSRRSRAWTLRDWDYGSLKLTWSRSSN